MITLYNIDAVHPILKRFIKSNLTEDRFNAIKSELITYGYEEKDMNTETIKIYEEGDKILITLGMYENSSKHVQETLEYIFGKDMKFPIEGTISVKRIDNKRAILMADWTQANEGWEQTSIYFLKELGFKFASPEVPYIPIKEANDELLNEDKKILKYLMIDNLMTEEEAINYMKKVYTAMDKAEVVFYRP